jgi:outer membrane protein
MMKIKISLADPRRLCAWLLLGSSLLAPAGRAQYANVSVDSLTLDEAKSLALQYHPALRGAEAGVQSASAGYRQALSSYFPALSFSGSVSHTEGAFVFNPSFPPRNQIYNNYTATLSLQQTIFDFGRTIGRVSASNDLVDAAGMDREATVNTVLMNAEVAYYSMLQAIQVVGVNEEAVEAAHRHLTQARAFYSVGRRPQLDVTKAEVDLANANVNLIRARNGLQVARVQLENAIGVRLPVTLALRDTFALRIELPQPDTVRAVAFSLRPELRASEARLSASSSLVTAAWTQHLPVLSAFGTYTWTAFDLPLYNRWVAGLSVTLPIFQGFAIDAQVQQARANEEISQSSLDELRQSVLLELKQNYLAVMEAQERLGATMKLVEQAEQALILAERQYTAGVGTALEITDAQLTRSNARISNIQALFDLSTSLVRLHRSMGLTP